MDDPNVVERFWSKVNKHAGIPPAPYLWVEEMGECWFWTGAPDPNGYGKFAAHGAMEYAHRVSVWLSGRDTPVGMHVDHLCRRETCLNPLHLEVVTPRENLDRAPFHIMMMKIGAPPAEPVVRTPCLNDDCERPSKVRGLCKQHYEQLRYAEVGRPDRHRDRIAA